MNNLHEKFMAASAEYLSRVAMDNLTEQSVTNYRNVLGLFGSFLKEQPQENEFVAVVAWKKKLYEDGLKPTTIRQYLIVLQIFFSAAAHRSYPEAIRFGDNPIDKTLLPKVPERPYEQVLTDEQVVKLYNPKCPAPRFKPTWARNYAMVMLALNEKIRNAELLDLRLSDVDMLHHVLTVRSGKGRKYREVDMCELTEQAITAYLNSGMRPAHLSDEDYLFGTTAAHTFGDTASRSGKEKWHRGTTNWLSTVIERVVLAVTGTPSVRSHDLRHVGSRVCLNAGQSMEQLQGELGHSNITTTQIYTSRLGSHRNRESAKAVLAARDEAAEQLKRKNSAGSKVVAFPA